MGDAIQAYLERYAEPEAQAIANHTPVKNYQRCLVIPVFNESTAFISRLIQDYQKPEALLVIIVVNQPDTYQDTAANQHFWQQLIDQYQTINFSKKYHWLTASTTIDLLLVNRFEEKIPHKQGVGLARKIGGDIACSLASQKYLSTSWIYHTDADAHLPDNYFSVLDDLKSDNNAKNISAAVYHYQHTPSGNRRTNKATQMYENSLQHYVDGLKKAGSPYAFHTLGSCIATNIHAYCQVRGFPKKSGGEDFYLLNKLAKVGEVSPINTCTIRIESRQSNRVPFGTGPAVEKILAMENPEATYLYYNPQCFIELASVIRNFATLFLYRDKSAPDTYQHYQPWLDQFNEIIQTALLSLRIATLFTHIDKQATNQAQCVKQCHQWLDGFKTLKFIHALEKHYPKVTLEHL